MGDYTIENVYQGGYSTLDSNKAYSSSFTGYRTNAGSLGLTTDPRTANIIKDASTKLSTGVKQIELALVSPELFDSIPKQQFAEMRELSKLTGIDISVHAPVIDSAGMSQQGFSKLNRESAERKITEALMRSHELNPNGNIPVVFHSAEGIPGSEWKTLGDVEGKKPREAKRLIAVDKDSGKMVPLEFEEKYYPGEDLSKPEPFSPERNLGIINVTDWDNKISQLFFNKERADEILNQNRVQIEHLFKDLNEKKERGEDPLKDLTSTQQKVYMRYEDAKNYLDEINRTARAIFSKGYEYGDEFQKEKLKKLSENYREELEKGGENTFNQSKAMHKLLMNMQNPALAPTMFVPIEKFATAQSSKTFGNAAFNAFSKFKDVNKTPMMVIENPPAGFGLSTGEDLKNLVVESRKQFVVKAKENGMGEGEAGRIAEKLIGATWDVGHINMLRKQGFKEEDIIRETEKIAPYVKHVHLSDNFGFEHTELPMGMGNVPMKEIMAKLGEKGFEGKKIIEAGTWWQHFQTPPIKETLEGLGSPMYSSGVGPFWNQSLGFQQGYYSGYGMMLPSNNYQTFGAGFSQLPSELGGEMIGAGGKFSQRKME